MALILDQSDIDAALLAFKIHQDEYHLSFEHSAVYMHWLVNTKTLKDYLKKSHPCLDFRANLDDAWIEADTLEDDIELPSPIDGFFSCRYIIAA